MNRSSTSSSTLFSLLLILCLIAYCLPWVVHPGSSLSLGAYDLAEWTSLHPAVRGENPALLTTLLLRLPLACLGLLMIVALTHKSELRFALLLLISVALLPPLEFFTQATNDPNYQQQVILAVITVLAGILLMVAKLRNARKFVLLALAGGALVSSIVGVLQSYALMRGFSLPTQLGLGVFAFVGLLGSVIVVTVGTILPDLKQTG